MKKALLIPWINTRMGTEGWQWQTPSERDIGKFFNTEKEALENRPTGYQHLDDAWNLI